MSHSHLTPYERMQIQCCRTQGMGPSAIAKQLNRDRSTISREFRRNCNSRGAYRAADAQGRYVQRRRACGPKPKLQNNALREHVEASLELDHSPEQIAGRLMLEYPDNPSMRISHEVVYRHVYEDKKKGGNLHKHLRQGRKTRRKRGNGRKRRGVIKDRVSIEMRPAIVDARGRVGDWEGDTMCGKDHKSHIATFNERKTMRLCIGKMRDKSADALNESAQNILGNIPVHMLHTLTVDNGKEFAGFKTLERALGWKVYFAHPYSSWERGANENLNGLIRQYLPKGCDLSHVTQEQLDWIADRINNRPRKKLNYRTPMELYRDAVAFDS